MLPILVLYTLDVGFVGWALYEILHLEYERSNRDITQNYSLLINTHPFMVMTRIV